ncbi:UNVERIFIED_CONTAM: hypothetical protein PYX00_005540 [Menopon gallinae]|uniref:Uncharacterized protein n=1 Tax=Menopon gallinae TaxID=328185 RepID=A0AAW2HS03_9NEOP
MELTKQLKTFEITDSPHPLHKSDRDQFLNENRRLTRSQILPKNSFWPAVTECPVVKTPRKVIDPEAEVKKIYLNNKVKLVHKNLETIYEDPVFKKGGNTMFLGAGKLKRSIYLDREFRITTKQKSKIRKMKIKRLGQTKKPFKMSEDEFKARMMVVDTFINDNNCEENRDGCVTSTDICNNNSEMDTL